MSDGLFKFSCNNVMLLKKSPSVLRYRWTVIIEALEGAHKSDLFKCYFSIFTQWNLFCLSAHIWRRVTLHAKGFDFRSCSFSVIYFLYHGKPDHGARMFFGREEGGLFKETQKHAQKVFCTEGGERLRTVPTGVLWKREEVETQVWSAEKVHSAGELL